jgi:hypothetical protein
VDCFDVTILGSLVNTLLELEDCPLDSVPGQVLPFIHRLGHRVHNLCTPTDIFTIQTTVPTSAYPEYYLWPWLLGESRPPDTCGWHLLSCTESSWRVISFRLSVWRARRVRLSTGFSGGEPWSVDKLPGPYPVQFWSSPVHVGLLHITMVQSSVCVPTHRHLLADVARLDSGLIRFSSRFTALRTSRYRGDDAVPCSREVGDCAQRRTISCQGSHLAAHPPSVRRFRANDSHCQILCKFVGPASWVGIEIFLNVRLLTTA